MILVDSSVWIDYFNGRPTTETGLLDGLLSQRRPLLGDLILAEVLQGFRSDLDFRRARHRDCRGAEFSSAEAAGRHRAQDDRHADCVVLYRPPP
jgi:predicted nucleic acid-binding protein